MGRIKAFNKFDDVNELCRRYDIRNYTINADGLVDVRGDVDLAGGHLKKIPIRFGHVTGCFYCQDNGLVSLEGSPKIVDDFFCCDYNKLSTLVGGPEIVLGDFTCERNILKSLVGCPKVILGHFICNDNRLWSVDGCPGEIGKNFICHNNPLYEIYSLFGNYKKFMHSLDWNYMRNPNTFQGEIIKSRFEEACEEAGVKIPKNIRYYKYI